MTTPTDKEKLRLDQRIDRILNAGGERIITGRGNFYGTPDVNVSEYSLEMENEEQFAAFLRLVEKRVAKKKASK